ncbi:MFS transporter [Roseomonas aerophila]|uniref:MFS transporter n=1 Tax=Teichococcus aerophilus TaxID=1224513 RepID=A0ABR7RPR6_9PROT|nr:MFS transporter [Pseudoroseomonas aerophila]MBC9208595.1 MFS transporter [Pseudoroseomonas aerophila]
MSADTALPAAFRRLSWSNLAAQLSEQVALAAAPLVAVLLLGAGAAEAGLLQTAQTLPFLLLSLPIGVLADRMSRRWLMAGAEFLRAASLLVVLALLVGGALNLPLLAALGFVGAIGTVAYSVAAPALVPSLVRRDQLATANRWLELARSIAFAAGPALGGALVGWTGASAAYVLATALSLLAALTLARLPESQAPARPRRHPLDELREGARFVGTHPLLRPVLLTAVFFNTGWFVLQAVYVAYAVQHLGLTAWGVGVTLAIYGGGMVMGAWVAPRLAARIGFGTLVVVGPACGLAGALLMLLSAWVRLPALAGLSFFLFGVGPILWTIATTTLRQAVTPQAVLGRVSAVVMTATFGARPLGAAIGALVAARLGVEASLAVAAGCFLVQFLLIAASPVPRLARLPDAVAA